MASDDEKGTGPNPGGTPEENKFAKRLQSAFKAAIKALGIDECNKLFGQAGSPDPVTVLTMLVGTNPGTGMILFDQISSPPGQVTSATTVGYNPYSKDIGNGTQLLLYAFVQVMINTQAGSFVSGTTNNQATTLLHELGHVYSDLYGPQSTAIVSDAGNLALSQQNTKTVEDNCFK
jgi:hypothetical protein